MKKYKFLEKGPTSDVMFEAYALNPFELSSRRFKEYTDEELLFLASSFRSLKIPKKVSLSEYVGSKNKPGLYSIYAALKEELKYESLKIISDIRFVPSINCNN